MTTELTEPELAARRGSPIWGIRRRQAEARAAEELARREARDQLRLQTRDPFQAAPLTEAQLAARSERVDYATRLRAWRGNIATAVQEADAALNHAVATLDLEAWTTAHARHVALVALAARLDNQARQSGRIPPFLPGGGRR